MELTRDEIERGKRLVKKHAELRGGMPYYFHDTVHRALLRDATQEVYDWLFDHAPALIAAAERYNQFKGIWTGNKPKTCEFTPATMLRRISELEREVDTLRRYGNKDCTAMADEELDRSAANNGEKQ